MPKSFSALCICCSVTPSATAPSTPTARPVAAVCFNFVFKAPETTFFNACLPAAKEIALTVPKPKKFIGSMIAYFA